MLVEQLQRLAEAGLLGNSEEVACGGGAMGQALVEQALDRKAKQEVADHQGKVGTGLWRNPQFAFETSVECGLAAPVVRLVHKIVVDE